MPGAVISGLGMGSPEALGDGGHVDDCASSSRTPSKENRTPSKENLAPPKRKASKKITGRGLRTSQTLQLSEVAATQHAWGSSTWEGNISQHDEQFAQPQVNRSKLIKRGSSGSHVENWNERRDFDMVMRMARKHQLPVEEVRERKEEFDTLDKDRSGTLSVEELIAAIRARCNLEFDEPIPPHLLSSTWASADKDSDGLVNFEEFLCWSISTAYSEEMLVTDPEERRMRRMARENGLLLPDVERVKDVFNRFDADGTGNIDEVEFRSALHALMNLKNPNDMSLKKMQRYWLEVDTDRSGTIEFDEFLLWYFNFFDM